MCAVNSVWSMSGMQDFHFSNRNSWMGDMFPRVPWPPPAHQSDLFSRSYGLYSLFPSPTDPGLYSPGGKLPPAFIPSPKVTEPLFTFTGGGHLPLSPHPALQQLEVLTKTYTPPRLHKTNDDLEQSRLHCFPSPVCTPRARDSPSDSPVTVIDLSTDHAKKMPVVKQEGTNEAYQKLEKPKKKTCRSPTPISCDKRMIGSIKIRVPSRSECEKVERCPVGVGSLNMGGSELNGSGKMGLPSPTGVSALKIGVSPQNGYDKLGLPSPGGMASPRVGQTEQSGRGKIGLPSPGGVAALKVGVSSQNGCGKLGLPSPGGRPITMPPSLGGCSRTTPVTFRPNEVIVKKEPLLSPVDASVFLSPPSDSEAAKTVKLESETDGLKHAPSGKISRQSYSSHLDSPTYAPPPSLLHPTDTAPLLGAVYPGGGVCDDRSTNHLPSWPVQSHTPTLWQYSATMDQHPSSSYPYQWVRDARTGQVFIFPQPSMEALPRTILWSPYASSGSPMMLSPPNPQHLLLDSSVTTTPRLVLDGVPPSMDFITPEYGRQPCTPHRTLIPSTEPTSTVIKLENASHCSSSPVVANDSSNSPVYSKGTINPSESVFYPSVLDSPEMPLKNKDSESRSQVASPVPERKMSPSPVLSKTPLPPAPLDVTGLELLSNSIEKHVVEKTTTPSPVVKRPFAVLCALAEQLRGSESQDGRPPALSNEKENVEIAEDSREDALSPPILEKVTDFKFEETVDISRPPMLTPHSPLCEPVIHEIKDNGEHNGGESRKRRASSTLTSASKKRKVGRPKKSNRGTEMLLIKRKSSEVKAEIKPKTNVDAEMELTPTRLSVVIDSHHLSLEQLPLRVLTLKGGKFYAGQLSAITAPDVYGITIDGERGNRPHIFSREEILKDTILEIKPKSTSQLPPGTRLCAYWSDQYRCLYPGTVIALPEPEPDDDRFVYVEFDGSDQRRIGLDEIRLLPPDHPVLENDPDFLLNFSKRKRRNSYSLVTELGKEVKETVIKTEPVDRCKNELVEEDKDEEQCENMHQDKENEGKSAVRRDAATEWRHLKKKRREKLKRLQSLAVDGTLEGHSSDGKKKHKKHHKHHHKKHRKHRHRHRDRQDSTESQSKMAAFLPPQQLWAWADKGHVRIGARGRAKKIFHQGIRRGKETIKIGDCAVFLSTGRPDRPFIGRIDSLWETPRANMMVQVSWFYHPEETAGCAVSLRYPGALFKSPHKDENEIQTISHKCEVLPFLEYVARMDEEPSLYNSVYENNDLYYLAGSYDPASCTLQMESDVVQC